MWIICGFFCGTLFLMFSRATHFTVKYFYILNVQKTPNKYTTLNNNNKLLKVLTLDEVMFFGCIRSYKSNYKEILLVKQHIRQIIKKYLYFFYLRIITGFFKSHILRDLHVGTAEKQMVWNYTKLKCVAAPIVDSQRSHRNECVWLWSNGEFWRSGNIFLYMRGTATPIGTWNLM